MQINHYSIQNQNTQIKIENDFIEIVGIAAAAVGALLVCVRPPPALNFQHSVHTWPYVSINTPPTHLSAPVVVLSPNTTYPASISAQQFDPNIVWLATKPSPPVSFSLVPLLSLPYLVMPCFKNKSKTNYCFQ